MKKQMQLPRQFRNTDWRGIALLTGILIILAAQISASVLVAPTSVYLSEKDRTGRMTIQNPSDSPKEISVYFSYGIPESDSVGNVRIKLEDSTFTDPKSARDWLRVFPRKMILAPGATQVIRFVARPPKDLADGEYWARIVIRSEGSQATIPVVGEEENITTKLNMIMQTAIILKYRTGNLVAKLDVNETYVNKTDSTYEVFIDMENRGNVSYVGALRVRLLDSGKKIISESRLNLAVYKSLLRKLELPIPLNNSKTPFQIEVSISNDDRKDLPPEGMIQGNSLLYTVSAE